MDFSRNEIHSQVFDILADTYTSTFGSDDYPKIIIDTLYKMAKPKAKVLDIGCGNGIPAALELATLGFDVTGIDISKKMIELASTNVKDGNFFQMNMEELQFADRYFDHITSFSSMLLLSQRGLFNTLMEVARVLKVGGLFIFTVVEGSDKNQELPIIFKDNKTKKPFTIANLSLHINHYQEQELKRFMAPFPFKCVWVKRGTYTIRYDNFREESHLCFCFERIRN